ncbi:hypothetical protein GQ457_01G020710 [Hibiscus cannabinus]
MCCQLFGKDLANVDFVTRHYCVDEQQPSSVYGLIVGGCHQIALDKCVPQFGLWQEAEAADGVWISTRCVPLCVGQTQNILDYFIIFLFKASKHGVELGASFDRPSISLIVAAVAGTLLP